MAIFRPKPCVNPLGKMSIFRLLELLAFIAQKGVFSLQNIVKDIFLAYIAYQEKVGKLAIFGPKPWVNPFGEMSIFRLFEVLFYTAQKGVFPLQNIVKDIFLAYVAPPPKKKIREMAIFGPKPCVNPFGKMSIFRLIEDVFLQPRKAFFCSIIS